MAATPPPTLADLLAFYKEAGVDEALEEDAVNRFAEVDRERKTQRSQALSISPLEGEMSGRTEGGVTRRTSQVDEPTNPEARHSTSPPSALPGSGASHGSRPSFGPPSRGEIGQSLPNEAQAARARDLARSASTLEELKEILAGFDGCNLKFTAKNLVFSDGNPEAPIMFVGEAPGRDEDIEGLPFVGVSGQLLDRMMGAIGLDRTRAYIANVIPWRPPGNRTPTPLETEICRPFIERQIELVNPKILVTLGNPSTKLLLNPQEGILRVRGAWRDYRTASDVVIPAMPTLHPAYLLRNPPHKKLAWRDFLEIKARLRSVLA